MVPVWLRGYNAAALQPDLITGITLAAYILPAAIAVCVMGCKRDESAPRYNDLPQSPAAGEGAGGEARVHPYGAQISPFPGETTQRIVAERCAREVRCSNIGPAKRYGDLNTCMAELGGKSREELGTYACKDGVNEKEVEQCLAEIRAEGCNSPLGALERMAACRSGLICLPSK